MRKNHKVGIIILTYNCEDRIERCLKSVLNQSYSNITVYLVDNDSHDKTLERVANYRDVVVIKNQSNTGFALGNNIGMRRALSDGCDSVFLLNDDAYIENDTIEKLISCLSGRKKVGAIQPVLLLHDDKKVINSFGNAVHYLGFGYAGGYKQSIHALASAPTDIPFATGAAVLYTKDALLDVEMFDEVFFMYHEDLDICWRMRSRGWDVALCKESRAYHEYSFSKGVKKYYFMERNRLIFLLKNFSLRYLLLILPIFLLTEVGLDLFSLKNGFGKQRVKAWLYFTKSKHRKQIFEARRIIQKNRTVSEKNLVKYLTDEIISQEVDSLFTRLGNRLFKAYFKLIRPFI